MEERKEDVPFRARGEEGTSRSRGKMQLAVSSR
jgi:hypothetical protein